MNCRYVFDLFPSDRYLFVRRADSVIELHEAVIFVAGSSGREDGW